MVVRTGFLIAVSLCLLCSCGGSGSGSRDLDPCSGELCLPSSDVTQELAPEASGSLCVPGTHGACTADRRHIQLCSEDGDKWLDEPCLDRDGNLSLCLDGLATEPGYCTSCVPGKVKCDGDEKALICQEDGLGWAPYKDCQTYDTGEVCVDGNCIQLCELNIKRNIYMGCDFWAADLDNAYLNGGEDDAAGAQYAVVVSNASFKYPAKVKVETVDGQVLLDSAGNPLPTEPLLPGELRVFNLPRRDVDGTTIAPLAYRISSSIPISAYQFNPLENVDVFSNDASLLLPSNVLGKYYYVMTREQSFDDLRGFLTVIGVSGGTTQVTVEVTCPTLLGLDARSGKEISSMKPGETRKFELGLYDTLNIETSTNGGDLTGSKILADRNVAVFGGSEAANAPNTNHCVVSDGQTKGVCEWDGQTPCKDSYDCTVAGFNTCCADHLEMQMFPVKSWGSYYLASRSFPRKKEKDVYRIIAAEDGTLVTTLPKQLDIPLLNRGEWVDFESGMNFEIKSNPKKPVMVGQFLAAQQAPDPNVNGVDPNDAGIGDPAFSLLVPTEQFRQDYVFLAPDKYALDYVTIVAPKDAKVWYDCGYSNPAQIVTECTPLADEVWEWFFSGNYKTAKFLIADGTHRLWSDKGIGVYVYGYDQYVSYSYPAGLDIKDLGLIKEPGEQ